MQASVSAHDANLEAMGECLAKARRTGALAAGLDLSGLASLDQAEALCDAAVRRLGWTQVGYALVGTYPAFARSLCLDDPLVAPMLHETIVEDGSSFRLPDGVMGAGVGLTVMLGRAFPFSDDERPTAANAATACLACRVDLHLLGRRAALPGSLDERTAAADFGLDVVRVAGPWAKGRATSDLAAGEASLAIDGNVVARGHGRNVLGDPLGAVAWLACRLAERGSGLNAGDLAALGSCTGLAQVLPDQTLTATFGDLGSVSLRLY